MTIAEFLTTGYRMIERAAYDNPELEADSDDARAHRSAQAGLFEAVKDGRLDPDRALHILSSALLVPLPPTTRTSNPSSVPTRAFKA